MAGDAPGAGKDAAPIIDVSVEDERWREVAGLQNLIEQAVGSALDCADGAPVTRAEISLVLANDAQIAGLNQRYRGKSSATNVLSFPSGAPAAAGTAMLLGDVVVSFETINRESREHGKSFENHLCHLIVHGVLHLLGYDHEIESCAETMEALEISALAQIGVPNPYEYNSEVTPPKP